MNDDGTIGLIFLFALFVAWPMAHTLNKHWKQHHPDKRPFTWGYFQSIMNIGCFAIVPFAFAQGGIGILIGVWMLGGGVCGFFMFRRQRWAWVMGTVISFNPWTWIINGVYLKNRWREMDKESASQPGAADTDAALYVSDHGEQSGPFSYGQLMQMCEMGTLSPAAFVCHVGDANWVPLANWKEANQKPSEPQKLLVNWLPLLQNVKDHFQPSKTMNYRVFIPCVLLAFLLGALAHNMLADRYVTQAMGSGTMLKTDRWTGKAWKLHSSSAQWLPVADSYR